jgi:hypothetical protein
MLRIEPALPMDKIDPALPMLKTLPTLRMLPTLQRLRTLDKLLALKRRPGPPALVRDDVRTRFGRTDLCMADPPCSIRLLLSTRLRRV